MKECHSLEDVRLQIDHLDDQIIDLVGQRNAYIKQAAKFKKSVEEVKADDRIDFIIQKVRRQANDMGISANMLEEIYRLMIDEMVNTEIAEFRNPGSF